MNIVIFNSSDVELKIENQMLFRFTMLRWAYILAPNRSYYNFNKTTLPYFILENGKESRISLRLHSLRWE